MDYAEFVLDCQITFIGSLAATYFMITNVLQAFNNKVNDTDIIFEKKKHRTDLQCMQQKHNYNTKILLPWQCIKIAFLDHSLSSSEDSECHFWIQKSRDEKRLQALGSLLEAIVLDLHFVRKVLHWIANRPVNGTPLFVHLTFATKSVS